MSIVIDCPGLKTMAHTEEKAHYLHMFFCVSAVASVQRIKLVFICRTAIAATGGRLGRFRLWRTL